MQEKKTSKIKTIMELDWKKTEQLINSIEGQLESLKQMLLDSGYQTQAREELNLGKSEGKIIEGIFNGEEMVDREGKKYKVSQNYASKSKLVPGDVLKLTISHDGNFLYKQIGPIERKKLIGIVNRKNDRYYVDAEGKNYQVLLASITYFKIQPGDKVTILVPCDDESNWAAIENEIK